MDDYLFIKAMNESTHSYFACVIYQERIEPVLYNHDNKLYRQIQKILVDFPFASINTIDGITAGRFTSVFGNYYFGNSSLYTKIAEETRKAGSDYFNGNPINEDVDEDDDREADDDYEEEDEDEDIEDDEEEEGF